MSKLNADPLAGEQSFAEQHIDGQPTTTRSRDPHLASECGLPNTVQTSSSTLEHPKGDEIRRQVEYYFSDENLPTDSHLLEKCQGRLNLPVSIRSICGFRKMRQYKPFIQVVESLKKSAFLDVVDGNKIKRKIPLMGKTILDEEDGDSDIDTEPGAKANQPKQKGKKGKQHCVQQPKVEKPFGFDRPHGFEEFFADAPTTPAEFQEELSMYDPGISFRLRMECAIQRYKSRRKMHEHFLSAFSKFMKYGGVDQSPRQFTGGIKDKELEERDAQDIALMMANHTIDPDKDEEDKWSVAFEDVAKGFLSSYLPTAVCYDVDQIRLATRVLRNFYNYLLHHSVCPEYSADIYAARSVCDLAESEFPKVMALSTSLPGDFNVACSNLFDGFYKDKYATIGEWDDLGATGMREKFATHAKEKSAIILKAAIGAHGTEKQVEILEKAFESITCTSTIETGLEITAVDMPSAEVLELYADLNAQTKGRLELKPLGKLHCKQWEVLDFSSCDLPEWYAKRLQEEQRDKKYDFWIEADSLQTCYVGMKMQACVRTLSLGILCLDQVHEVYCSFYTYLANELMGKWKEPNFEIDLNQEASQAKVDGDDSDAD